MQLPPEPKQNEREEGRGRTKLIAISLEVRFYACLYCVPLFRWLILIDNKFNDQELDNRETPGRVGCGNAPAEPDSHSGISWPAVRTTHPFEVDSLGAECVEFWGWRSSKYGWVNFTQKHFRILQPCKTFTVKLCQLEIIFNVPYYTLKLKYSESLNITLKTHKFLENMIEFNFFCLHSNKTESFWSSTFPFFIYSRLGGVFCVLHVTFKNFLSSNSFQLTLFKITQFSV